jgi:hypothetical protein
MKKTDTEKETGQQRADGAEEAAPNEFAVALARVDKGKALGKLSDNLIAIVQACRATGKKGRLTLKLHVKPVAKTEGRRVMIEAEIETKAPDADIQPALLFTTESGQLVREDPDQVDWIDEAEKRAAAERREAKALQGKITRADLEASVGR